MIAGPFRAFAKVLQSAAADNMTVPCERGTNLAGTDNGVLRGNSPFSQRMLSIVEG